MDLAARAIGAILRHDKKVNSYKLALIRAINDVVLSYPDLAQTGKDIAVPLRRLAEYWLAYYWPFVDPISPIFQGPRAKHGSVLRNDLAFRPALTDLKTLWMQHFGASRPRYCQMLWTGRSDHAATFSSFLSTNSPFLNSAPALTSATRWAPVNFLHLPSAASISL